MSSINTNVASMQALQSLQQTNQSLEQTQNRISTGFKVENAKDNAAIWSVAQVMRSDISGFDAISEQLSLGESTVAVARNASETVSDLTEQIKERVVAAQGDNVDRDKIQADIKELVGQVQSVVDAAQFNGSNLLKDASGTQQFDILSSLDRNSNQEVNASRISVDQVNLSTEDGALDATQNANLGDDAGVTAEVGYTGADTLAAGDVQTMTVTFEDATDGGGVQTVTFDVSEDASGDIVSKLDSLGSDFSGATATADDFTVAVAAGSALHSVSFSGGAVGMQSMEQIDVTTAEGAENALGAMEGFTQHAIDAAANFGQAQMRVETQMDFVGKLTDSLTAGVGSLVDANMTEESAKLNALQVQQQLGTQALSIANQAPQALLSLFR